MNQESKLLIQALRRAMTGAPAEIPEELDWKSFLMLARDHNVLGLVYSGIKDLQLPEEVSRFLSNAYHQEIFRDSQLEYVKDQLQQKLVQAQIPHIFLKGALLKYDYPIPALRTMSDLDVLVYTRDYDRLDKAGEALGAQMFTSDGNHRNYRFPGGVLVECHPNIVHHASPVAAGVNPGWQYAKPDCPTAALMLTEEGFYLSMICHMADHFVSGGIGVRFVLDVWVFRNLRKEPVDWAFVDAELEKFGLLAFTRRIEELAQVWFGGGQTNPVMEELAEYILTSGSHGIASREMLNAMSLSKGGDRKSVLWSKLFYPRAELEDRFPWAKGKPWLLPAAWCARAYKAVTIHGRDIRAWSKKTGDITAEEVAQQREKLARFGIEKKHK